MTQIGISLQKVGERGIANSLLDGTSWCNGEMTRKSGYP